jgi:hypothetical protein
MKTINTKILFCFILLCCGIENTCGQTFCLTEISNDGTNLVIKIEMQAAQPFSLADANLVLTYDDSSLGVPAFASSPLGPPSYFIPTVSTPAPETASINIVLPFTGFGTAVDTSPNWFEIIQITFPIIDDSAVGQISWAYNGGTNQTVVFADDPLFPVQIFANDVSCLSGYTPAPIEGCADSNACNYNIDASQDDGSCILIGDLCDDNDSNTSNDMIDLNCVCTGMSQNSCPTDFNGNGTTNGTDFTIFLGNFSVPCDPALCPTDLNGDGATNGVDFTIFLGNFGLDCN